MINDVSFLGEKMSEEEVDLLVSGMEDNQGQINYEGNTRNYDKDRGSNREAERRKAKKKEKEGVGRQAG